MGGASAPRSVSEGARGNRMGGHPARMPFVWPNAVSTYSELMSRPYPFLDGVSLRLRRPSRRQRVQMLVAYGVGEDGSRHLLGFLRSKGESQTAWEGLLQDLHRRDLTGEPAYPLPLDIMAWSPSTAIRMAKR
jgi:hypothetical protein